MAATGYGTRIRDLMNPHRLAEDAAARVVPGHGPLAPTPSVNFTGETREESDTMGTVLVPVDKYWCVQTSPPCA